MVKEKKGKGKFFIITLLIIVCGLGVLAMQDIAPPTKTVTKIIGHEALK